MAPLWALDIAWVIYTKCQVRSVGGLERRSILDQCWSSHIVLAGLIGLSHALFRLLKQAHHF